MMIVGRPDTQWQSAQLEMKGHWPKPHWKHWVIAFGQDTLSSLLSSGSTLKKTLD